MTKNTDDFPLISAVELREMLGDENIKVFDLRGKWGPPQVSLFNEYAQGHIPGAVYLDWLTCFLESGVPTGLASLSSKAQAQGTFKALGISSDDTVILYDDYHHMLAGRVWWAMRYWGFSNVKVLNGGWNYWLAKKFPSSVDVGDVGEGTFIVTEQAHLNVNVEDVKNRPDSRCLIDARGPISYGGDPSDSTTGHVPGAINLPYSSLLDPHTGLFKSTEYLEVLFANELKGLDKNNLISSCGSGYAGTVLLIALRAIGIDAPLFDGSFSAWKKSGTLPIEQGPFPTVR